MKYYLCIRSLFWIRLYLFLTRSVNICILLWDMMLGISPLLCTCQCLSTHLQPSLSCYLSIWLLALSLLSLSILIPHHSFCRSIMHICFLSLSLSLPLSLSLWWSNVPCVSLCSAVWSEWRVNTRERERERLCVWLVFQRLEEHAVPFWMGILKAQSYSCCLCVSSPWPHVYKPRPQSQLFNKPKIQCISIIISNSQSCVMSGVFFFWGGGGGRYLKLVMLSLDLS